MAKTDRTKLSCVILLLQAVLKMLNEIGTVDNIPEFIEGVKNRSAFLSDFAADMLT